MKLYQIFFEQRQHNVWCDHLKITDGVTAFVVDGNIIHIAPKEALIIDVSQDVEDYNLLEKFVSKLMETIREDEYRLKEFGDRSTPQQQDNYNFLRRKVEIIKNIERDFRQLTDRIRKDLF